MFTDEIQQLKAQEASAQRSVENLRADLKAAERNLKVIRRGRIQLERLSGKIRIDDNDGVSNEQPDDEGTAE